MITSVGGQTYLEAIRSRLQSGELPGYSAQEIMGHSLRQPLTSAPPTARAASVLALIYPIKEVLHLLFIQRTSPPGDRHGGQISFPGGSADPADTDPADTALREAEEEVGIDRNRVTLLGELTPLYIPVSNFLVNPFVGYLPVRPTFTLQVSEVARILELPLADFFAEGVIDYHDKELYNGMLLKDVPHWMVAGEEIWGATAMMVGELVAIGRW